MRWSKARGGSNVALRFSAVKLWEIAQLLRVTVSVTKAHISALHYSLCDLLKHILLLRIRNPNTAAEGQSETCHCSALSFPHSPLQDTTTKLERKCVIIGARSLWHALLRLQLDVTWLRPVLHRLAWSSLTTPVSFSLWVSSLIIFCWRAPLSDLTPP